MALNLVSTRTRSNSEDFPGVDHIRFFLTLTFEDSRGWCSRSERIYEKQGEPYPSFKHELLPQLIWSMENGK